MFTIDTYLRRDTYNELVLAMSDARVGHLITGRHYQARIIFPDGTERMPLAGEVARTLYRTPNGTVFAWVDAYAGKSDVFQLSSAKAWDYNVRHMSVIS